MIYLEQQMDWVVATIVVVWLLGVLLDFTYRVKRTRLMRIMFWTLAMTSAASIYLRPYSYQQSPAVKLSILGDSFGHLMDSLDRNGHLVCSDSDYYAHLQTANITELALFGHALQPWELKELNVEKISFTSEKLNGIFDFQLPQVLHTGEESTFHLSIRSGTDHLLYLSLGETTLDTSKVAKGETLLEMKYSPKAAGNFLLKLTGIASADTLYQESLAIKVTSPELPAVLMLNSNPNFEARFLKNLLSDFGYAVSSRTVISRNIANEEFINTERKDLTYLSDALLEQMQLVVMDAQLFDQLSIPEQRRLIDMNKYDQLGILVIGSTPNQMGKLWSVVPNSKPSKTSIYSHETITYKIENESIEAIKSSDTIIGYFQTNGIGKIGLLGVQDLYQMALEGNTDNYKLLVKQLTQPLMPIQLMEYTIQLPRVVRKHMKTRMYFSSKSEQPQIIINGIEHPVRESVIRPNYYQTDFWPPEIGWNRLLILPDSIGHTYFVYPPNAWNAKAHHKLNEYNRCYAESFKGTKPTSSNLRKDFISKWYFLIGFIIPLSIIWVEQRFFNP